MGYFQQVKTKIVYRDTVLSKMEKIKKATLTDAEKRIRFYLTNIILIY